jgi:hypothetical protein
VYHNFDDPNRKLLPAVIVTMPNYWQINTLSPVFRVRPTAGGAAQTRGPLITLQSLNAGSDCAEL